MLQTKCLWPLSHNSFTEVPSPTVDAFGDKACEMVIKVKEVIWVGAQFHRVGALIEEEEPLGMSPDYTKNRLCEDTARWQPPTKTDKRLQNEASCVNTLIMEFQPQNCERIHFYRLSHPTYSILLWQLEQTKIIHLGLSLICTLDHTCRQALFPVFLLKG